MSIITPTDELVQRAVWFKVFSLLFRYPDHEIIAVLKEGVSELPLGVLDVDLRINAESFKHVIANAAPDQFLTEFSDLFTGAGLCRANENDYEKLSFSMTEKLADVAGFYSAFGFEINDSVGERPDFIGTELDFINLLLLKQAYAIKNGWSEQASISADALSSFMEAHFIKWVPKFCFALSELGKENGIYATAADALAAMVNSESNRLTHSST
ncbi:MAG: molecular chaperone TorD family protein [SAR202 cluster bacterium]|jgi:TorA maturation chaperone TorD|nr:molecular chaperone TorD family protein [SAR202 cluster bacterium]|tara:strand:+ start:1616 stop:2254 length:639 start_codon:yes stop_codon:yes gene_type:complete